MRLNNVSEKNVNNQMLRKLSIKFYLKKVLNYELVGNEMDKSILKLNL